MPRNEKQLTKKEAEVGRDKLDALESSDELVAVVRRWIKALETKNADVIAALFSTSAALRYIGSDPKEIFQEQLLRDGYAQHIGEMPEFRSVCHSVEAFQRGDVGWAIWLGEWHFVESGEKFPWRFSLVLMLEAGIWKIVHVHSSTPRSNVEIIGDEHAVFQRLMEAARAEGDIFGVEGTATIMFTDVANSTSIAAFVGNRAWTMAINRHLHSIQALVEAHDGALVKTIGDGTMSSFTSARAAMLAAIAVQRAAGEEGAEPALLVRVGLHAGDVVQTDGDFFGTVVNKAARIASIAEPGTILVSDTARALTTGDPELHFEAQRAVALRGIEGEHFVSVLHVDEREH